MWQYDDLGEPTQALDRLAIRRFSGFDFLSLALFLAELLFPLCFISPLASTPLENHFAAICAIHRILHFLL
jgi:hypothetical protein